MMRSLRFSALLAFLLLPLAVSAAEYAIDPSHSEISFKIRHMGISKVAGAFEAFTGVFSYDPEHPEQATARATIQLASIDTDDAKRDRHLRSPDFFDVDKFPEMSFASDGVSDVTEDGFKLSGVLDLHGVRKPVVLDVEFNGLVTDPWGKSRAGFSASTKIDRRDFGLTWNKNLGAGELLVGNTVSIVIEIEGIVR